MKNIFPGIKEKTTIPQSIKTDDGETIIDKPTIAQKFNECFTGAMSRLLETAGPSMNVRQFPRKKITTERFILQPISEKFILKQLRDLKVKKATGLDGIPARFLKDSTAVITPTVTFLVNLSLSTGSVPDEWKKARVVPLYKSGGHENMDNYRPISILPVLSKILEKVQQYLKTFDILSPTQSGFRQHHSTESAVIYFTDEIRRHADAGRLTGTLFVDLKNLFLNWNVLALWTTRLPGLQTTCLIDLKLYHLGVICRFLCQWKMEYHREAFYIYREAFFVYIVY